jgi:hypothetical protein
MRLIIGALALTALVGLTSAPAKAEIGDMTRFHYKTCSCTFGYPGNACVAAISCINEGGYCSGSCNQEGQTSKPPLRVRG